MLNLREYYCETAAPRSNTCFLDPSDQNLWERIGSGSYLICTHYIGADFGRLAIDLHGGAVVLLASDDEYLMCPNHLESFIRVRSVR